MRNCRQIQRSRGQKCETVVKTNRVNNHDPWGLQKCETVAKSKIRVIKNVKLSSNPPVEQNKSAQKPGTVVKSTARMNTKLSKMRNCNEIQRSRNRNSIKNAKLSQISRSRFQKKRNCRQIQCPAIQKRIENVKLSSNPASD